jgi:protocatechuate 3,4-dioxygenase beta subunit
MKRAALAAAFAIIAAPAAWAQSSNLSGRVVADSTGDAIANARVTLTTAAVTATLGTPVVLTDAAGRFEIAAAAGQRVVASKSGYARSEPLPAAAGQPIEIRLRRGATISGRVVDRFGDPVPAARVAAQAPSATENSPNLAVADSDDRGEYRLAGLPAGRFIVVVNTATMTTTPEIFGNRQVLISRPVVQKTYYPGASMPAGAQAFDLQFGDERPDIDFVVSANDAMGNPFGVIRLMPGPLQPPANTGVGTGGIRGHVVGNDGRGLSHAQVRLMQAGFGVRATTAADEDGTYEFTDLPAGKFAVVASKMGYSPVGSDDSPLALLLNSESTVDLIEGQTRDKVDVKLRRWGTLEGRVFDELGDPIQGAAVQLLHIRYENGRRRLVPAGGAAHPSDDRGRYRIYALPPGRYVVSATVGDAADLPGYARSYFPGTPTAGQAQFVSVGVSQDVAGIDFSMSRTGTARISGRLIDAAGQPTTGGTVQLLPSARSGSATGVPTGARILPDGQFEFANVPPGQYVIQTYRGRQGGGWIEGEFASLPVTVNGTDIKNLIVQASAGSSINGRITFDTFNASEPPARSAIELSPIPTDFDLSPQNNLAVAEIHDDWSFDIKGVNGPRRLQLMRAPKGWTLEEILVHRLDATDRPLPFGRPNQSLTDVEVVLTDRMTELSGTIADDRATPAAGASLIVFPTNRDRWYPSSRYLRTTAAGSDGAFTLSGLPTGTYYAAAAAKLPQEGREAWQDPAFLESLVPRASTVTLSDGQRVSLNLRLPSR